MTTESNIRNIPLPEDHELIEHYQPRFLGMGGDHLVYEVGGHPDVVIKASTYYIKDILLGEKTKDLVATEILIKNDQIRELRAFWGKKHTVPERRYLMRVPISKDLLDEIFKNDWLRRVPPNGYESLKEVWTSVIVQEKVPEINNPEHKSFSFGGFVEDELENIDQVQYEKLNHTFITHETVLNEEDLNLFFNLQDSPKTHHLKDLIKQAESDNELKEMLKKFVLQAIDFAIKTGNILALAGENNVIFYKKDNGWNYLLIDATPVHSGPVFKASMEILHKIMLGENIDIKEKDLLKKGLNFTRTINGFAKSLGLNDFLDIINTQDSLDKINFSRIFKASLK